MISGVKAKRLREIARDAHVTFVGTKKAPDAALRSLGPIRVGLYKPWRASMDEGWTRLVLENFGYGIRVTGQRGR